MKSNNIQKSCTAPLQQYSFKNILFVFAMLIGLQTSVSAQDNEYTRPSWYFGVAGGANFNSFKGTTQQIGGNFRTPTPFYNGDGIGLYAGVLTEYYKPNTLLGFMFQAGLDVRKGQFDQITSVCNCPEDLQTNLSYWVLEPSLRIAPFRNNFYIYGGPRLAFNHENMFDYHLGVNPDVPEQEPSAPVQDHFSETENFILSMQVGAGYDIPLSSARNKTQFVLSPFVSFHPYFGQNPRKTESWTVTTIRAGLALKFGQGSRVGAEEEEEEVKTTPAPYTFTINSPANSTTEPKVRETFPLRNYVFFDLGSTEIPERYVLLQKSEVKDFKEDQLEMFKPKNLSGRSDRSMTVYYNILNILGDRMQKNPNSTITLVGSSEKGPEDGKKMATSVKTHLTDIFSISPSRIAIEGRTKPKLPSEQEHGTKELELLRQGDRRVSIESNSADLLMEFRSGPEAPLKPVEFVVSKEAPESSYVTLDVAGAKEAFATWTVEMKDEQGKIKTFGPYTEEKASIPGSAILGTKAEGDYKMTLIGVGKDGTIVKEEKDAHVVLWQPAADSESMRFSVIYEFNSSESISIYEKYLSEIVAPKIPKNGHVLINGYTDSIGESENNTALSLARANDVKQILQNSLAKAGRSDVTFTVNGNGENDALSPFNNNLPEERFYNRTVVIDILPAK